MSDGIWIPAVNLVTARILSEEVITNSTESLSVRGSLVVKALKLQSARFLGCNCREHACCWKNSFRILRLPPGAPDRPFLWERYAGPSAPLTHGQNV